MFKRRPYEISVDAVQALERIQPTIIRDSRNNEIHIDPRHDVAVIDDGEVLYLKDFDSPTITRDGDKLKIRCKFGPVHVCDADTTVVIYDLTKTAVCYGSNHTICI